MVELVVQSWLLLTLGCLGLLLIVMTAQTVTSAVRRTASRVRLSATRRPAPVYAGGRPSR